MPMAFFNNVEVTVFLNELPAVFLLFGLHRRVIYSSSLCSAQQAQLTEHKKKKTATLPYMTGG